MLLTAAFVICSGGYERTAYKAELMELLLIALYEANKMMIMMQTKRGWSFEVGANQVSAAKSGLSE